MVPKPVGQFVGRVVTVAAGRHTDQVTPVAVAPPTAPVNCCVKPRRTVNGAVAVPAGATVTPIGVEFPPHPTTQAARIKAAPNFQTLITIPPASSFDPPQARRRTNIECANLFHHVSCVLRPLESPAH